MCELQQQLLNTLPASNQPLQLHPCTSAAQRGQHLTAAVPPALAPIQSLAGISCLHHAASAQPQLAGRNQQCSFSAHNQQQRASYYSAAAISQQPRRHLSTNQTSQRNGGSAHYRRRGVQKCSTCDQRVPAAARWLPGVAGRHQDQPYDCGTLQEV